MGVGKGGALRVGWGLGPRSVCNIALCPCGKAFPAVSLRVAPRVPVSMRVLRARQQGVHDSWQHVLSRSHVFLLLTLNIYSTADRDIWCLFIICSWSLNRAINGAF